MELEQVLQELEALANAEQLEGQRRFGITPRTRQLGASIPALRALARRIGKDHALARQLWPTRIHEARILAGMVADPAKVTPALMDRWARQFDSWDLCDQVCSNLFDRTRWAWDKAVAWADRPEEFVKRAGFALMACLAVHDKAANVARFRALFPVIERHADDDRNYVRKAVNWALRQIGKRNATLNRAAIASAKRIARIDAKPARWIATDALRELTSEKVQRRLRNR